MIAMLNRILNFVRSQPRWRLITGAAVACVALLFLFRRAEQTMTDSASFNARRGPLQITVLEGGTLQALDSQELKCEVRVGFQGTKILRIADEGYFVTEEDVKSGKVLVELDSSELQKALLQQEIILQNAAAGLTDAQQAYDIQLNQNISDMMAVEQKARFARMDFAKFLGSKAADEVINQLGVDEKLMFAKTNRIELHLPDALLNTDDATNVESADFDCASSNGVSALPTIASAPFSAGVESRSKPASADPVASDPPRPSSINFAKYADIDVLTDGEAKQKIRKFQDDLQVAQKEMGQAQATLEGTRRLFTKQFVTRTDLQRDEIAYENTRLKMQTAWHLRATCSSSMNSEDLGRDALEVLRSRPRSGTLAQSRRCEARTD
jgi:multidrug efflux pump subunit AcrA (membrane-fusion protein)